MTLHEEIEKGHEGRYSLEELVKSDLPPQEKGQAELVRLEGIRRRWLPHANDEPKLVRALGRDRVVEDVEFQRGVIDGLRKIITQLVKERENLQFAAQRLTERVKRMEAEKSEKKIIAPNGRDMRAVLSSRRG